MGPIRFHGSFQGENGQTKVTMECDHDIPSSLLSKIARPFIERLNEHEARVVLDNLKARNEIEQGGVQRAQPRAQR